MIQEPHGRVPDDEVQAEGQPDRLYLGIDGTMGDAQDVRHPFVASIFGDYCRVCGLNRVAGCHGSRA